MTLEVQWCNIAVRFPCRHIVCPLKYCLPTGSPGGDDLDDAQELNYAGICKAIAEPGYDLCAGHEFKPKGDIGASL